MIAAPHPAAPACASALALLLACAHPASSPASPEHAPPTPPDAGLSNQPDELTLERTACSGACPVYTLTVRADGQVHFVGRKDVALVGERHWRIDSLYARHLFTEVDRSGFLTLGPRYPTEVEELPGLVLTLRRAGNVHRVQLGGAGTADLSRDVDAERLLQRLGTLVDKLTGCGRYVEADSKKKGAGCVD
ncbi:MAG: DUF6438 domain-containing protein [Myxococcota bacterium]